MREALERLNSGDLAYKFILVCEAGKLNGTVTDGDIRRALLRGVRIGDPVSQCMKYDPVVGHVSREADSMRMMREVASLRAFLPVVDDAGIVQFVLVGREEGLPGTALIMAGGMGKRLGERTRNIPKPLLPVSGKPILGHILDRLENANVGSIYVSTNYLADKIDAFVATRAGHVPIELLTEREPLGTAGSIGLLPDPMPAPFIVINGDILTKLDFAVFQDFHSRHKNDATIAVAQHQVTVPYGVIRIDDEGQFFGIDEKPTLTQFVAAGIYLLSPEFRALIRSGERLDMPELIERGRRIGLKFGLFPIHEYWTDIGRPEDLENAQLAGVLGSL
jgi:dTDP-glucose pyrophosphorylase